MDTSFSQTNPPVYVPDQGLGRQALLAVVGERQLNLGRVEFSLDGKEIEKNQKFAQETISHTNCSLMMDNVSLGVKGEGNHPINYFPTWSTRERGSSGSGSCQASSGLGRACL